MPRVARIVAVVAVALSLAQAAWASDLAERGVRLFMENKPQEALSLLEAAAREPGAAERTHLYLGVCYQQLGRWEDAIAAFRRGLAMGGPERHVFHFNIANSFFALGRNSFAVESYDQALAARGDYAPAYLNRANAKMRTGDQAGAVSDYSAYLSLAPDADQSAEIRRLLELLGQRAAEAERLKALEEAKRLAEEAARKALQDAVAESLRLTAESTTSLSAGSGALEGYDDELSLDD